MTTDDDRPAAPLPPEQEARVRRLLAEARATGPVPADVARRIDDLIAGLAAERAAASPVDTPGNVRPLVRTRRHRLVAVLGAAAAVVVFGLAIGTFFQSGEDAANEAAPADTGAVDRGDAASADDDSAAREEAPEVEATPQDAMPSEEVTLSTDQPAARLYSRHLAHHLGELQHRVLPQPITADYSRATITAPANFPCASADWGRGVLVAVRYDGKPALVAFREPMGRSQVAEVLQCGTGEVLRSVTLPATE